MEQKKKRVEEYLGKLREEAWEIESNIINVKGEINSLKQNLRSLYTDMEQEVGQTEEKNKDIVANRYGGEFNDLENELSKKQKELAGFVLKLGEHEDNQILVEDKIDDLEEGISNKNEKIKEDIFKAYNDNLLKGGKKANVGEVREWSGKKFKKQANGKWVEVSEHGMTKKEHETESDKKLFQAKKHGYKHAPGGGNWGSPHKKEINHNKKYDKLYMSHLDHRDLSSKLSDKEHSDEEVGLVGKPYKKKEGKEKKEEVKIEGKDMIDAKYKRMKEAENDFSEALNSNDTQKEVYRQRWNDSIKNFKRALENRGITKDQYLSSI